MFKNKLLSTNDENLNYLYYDMFCPFTNCTCTDEKKWDTVNKLADRRKIM